MPVHGQNTEILMKYISVILTHLQCRAELWSRGMTTVNQVFVTQIKTGKHSITCVLDTRDCSQNSYKSCKTLVCKIAVAFYSNLEWKLYTNQYNRHSYFYIFISAETQVFYIKQTSCFIISPCNAVAFSYCSQTWAI